jgi:uncharacterized protein
LRSKAWDREAELVIFDELHKMRTWKAWGIKGVFDTEGLADLCWQTSTE